MIFRPRCALEPWVADEVLLIAILVTTRPRVEVGRRTTIWMNRDDGLTECQRSQHWIEHIPQLLNSRLRALSSSAPAGSSGNVVRWSRPQCFHVHYYSKHNGLTTTTWLTRVDDIG